jgi:Mlc titration factor MtfA (ptsG expression regulator)
MISDKNRSLALAKYYAHLPYYSALDNNGRQKFDTRCVQISKSIQIKGMEGIKLSLEMYALIAASIVQITFGFSRFFIPAFKRILLYPSSFYHSGNKVWMKGFASANTLALSWDDFLQGYAKPNDNYNLGLHELAHALHLNLRAGQVSDKVFDYYFLHWEDESIPHLNELQNKTPHFLREYAGENIHEFFAVCVEHFFENPKLFKAHLPELYLRTSLLLNQDPLSVDTNYSLDLGPTSSKIHRKNASLANARYIHEEGNWTLALSAVGIFAGPALIYLNTDNTFIGLDKLLLCILLLTFLGLGARNWFFQRGLYDNFFFFLLFCLGGFGMLGTSALAILNNHIILETRKEIHVVTDTDSHNILHFNIADERYRDYESVLMFTPDMPKPHVGVKVEMNIGTGLLGVDNLESLQVVY